MEHIALGLLAGLLGGLGRRVAGGVLNQWAYPPALAGTPPYIVTGDTPARLFFGLTVAIAAALAGASGVIAALMIPAVWLGTTTGMFNSIAMGRGQYTALHDWLGMSAHAALSAATPALLLLWFGVSAWWLVGLTMLAAPLYWLGWATNGHGNNNWPVGLKGGSEVGEALWGAACALGAFLCFC